MRNTTVRQTTEPQMQVKRAVAWSAVARSASRINKSQLVFKPDEAVFLERLRIAPDSPEGTKSKRIRDRDWNRIKAAFENRNWPFLEKLLKVLKKRPASPLKKDTVAEQFLKKNWRTVRSLTDEEMLTEAQEWCLRKNLLRDSISDDSLKKARQRLGFFKSIRRG